MLVYLVVRGRGLPDHTSNLYRECKHEQLHQAGGLRRKHPRPRSEAFPGGVTDRRRTQGVPGGIGHGLDHEGGRRIDAHRTVQDPGPDHHGGQDGRVGQGVRPVDGQGPALRGPGRLTAPCKEALRFAFYRQAGGFFYRPWSCKFTDVVNLQRVVNLQSCQFTHPGSCKFTGRII